MNSKHLTGWLAAVVLSAASATAMAQSGGMMGDGASRGMKSRGGPGMGPNMKPGMMGGDGPAACGYHAMEGESGHGMGMGMGMMSGHHGHLPPDLTDKQRSAINKIHDEFTKKQWELNGKLLDEYPRLRDLHAAETRDPKAIGAEYARIFDVRRQMIELTVDMHNRVDAVFTKEQRDAMHKHGRGPRMGQ